MPTVEALQLPSLVDLSGFTRDQVKEYELTANEFRWHAIAQMMLEGKDKRSIAKTMRLSQRAVDARMREIRDAWLNSTLIAYDDMRAQEAAKINNIEMLAWETILALEGTEEFDALAHKRHTAAYDRVKWAIEARIKMFGLNAPLEIISWQKEAQAAGVDIDMLYKKLVQEMSLTIDGTVLEIAAPKDQENDE